MLEKIFLLVLVTFLPFLELRASIPFGLWDKPLQVFGFSFNGLALSPLIVFPVVVIANILIGVIIFFILTELIHLFIRFNVINSFYQRIVIRTQKKAHPLVEKYGLIGVALFIAVPLPGSGVYTGALAAHLLGIGYKKFLIAEIIGVLIAATIVTTVTLGFLNLPVF